MARTFSDGVEGQPGAGPESTLASGISVGAVSCAVQAGHGLRFPTTGDFSIRFEDPADPSSFENLTATARSTDTITHDPTTFAWGVGTIILMPYSKLDMESFLQSEAVADAHVADATEAHDASAVPILDTAAGYTATEVEGALAEVTTSLAGKQALSAAGGKELGYTQVTANQTAIGTTETDLTGLSVTVTCDGVRPILIVGFTLFQQNTSASLYLGGSIKEGATTLAECLVPAYAATVYATSTAYYRGIPTAGAHTYKLAARTQANTMSLQAGSAAPAFIQVIQLGT